MTNAYLAGKVRKNDWRHQIVPKLRTIAYGWDYGDRITVTEATLPTIVKGTNYVGPVVASSDHGTYHGNNTHGASAWDDEDEPNLLLNTPLPFQWWFPTNIKQQRDFIFKDCIERINLADFMFVWAEEDFHTAHGTHFEMGYAHSIKCPIILAQADPSFTENSWFALKAVESQIIESNPALAFVDAVNTLITNRLLRTHKKQ